MAGANVTHRTLRDVLTDAAGILRTNRSPIGDPGLSKAIADWLEREAARADVSPPAFAAADRIESLAWRAERGV